MKVYAFMPAKGTSERIKNKNMQYLNSKRLFINALEILLKCKEIDKVFLDTESEEMIKMVDYLPVEIMKRDPVFATNKVDGHQMLLNEIKHFSDADIYVQLLCTSPFIKPETIDNAIRKLKYEHDNDSAILMRKDKLYLWDNGQPTYDAKHIPNSKDLPETIIESMGLYVIKKETALNLQRRFGEKPFLIFGEQEELIDVNNPEDLVFAENYSRGIKAAENGRFRLIKHFLTSPSLSDIIDDINIETGECCGAVINGFKSNLGKAKVLGRANTIRLRKLNKNEDFHGIYDALSQYESISDNDVIMVENELNSYAYFGDLNAHLAIRSGASATIIDGVTRDLDSVSALNFPVFCTGYNACDVRRRATLDYINKPIQIKGITVNPGDLIFADNCSVVVVYKKHENEILERVLHTFKNEKDIVNDIFNKKEVGNIIENRGAF